MMLIKPQRECASFTGSSMSTAGVLALSATAADLCTPHILDYCFPSSDRQILEHHCRKESRISNNRKRNTDAGSLCFLNIGPLSS